MALRGIRGAATVETNSREEIWKTAQLLITKMMSANELSADDVGVIIFSSTRDLTAAFPTSAVRQLPGFNLMPLFDAQEPEVENDLPMCIRALILVDCNKTIREISHVYLGAAKKLRPDLN